MLGSIMTMLSLRRCFYISSVVVIFSTMMAALIIVKLSPLESVKSQPYVVTSPNEWTTSSSSSYSASASASSSSFNFLSPKAAVVGNNNEGELIMRGILKKNKEYNNDNDNNNNNDEDEEEEEDGGNDQRIEMNDGRRKKNNNNNEERIISQNNNNNNNNKISRISNKMRKKLQPLLTMNNKNKNSSLNQPNYNIHIFYYPWYRSVDFDDNWRHWNHDYLPNWKKNDNNVYKDGRHVPPLDIGANYYPSLGCYSSLDPKVIDLHMKQLREAGVGVVVVSWIPPNSLDSTDSVMSELLDTAHRYDLKIAPHIEPYAGRNPINLIEHLKYLFNEYGSHPALHRIRRETDGSILPVMYIYDSYHFPATAWWELLSDRGNLTLRGTDLDAIYIGLLVDAQHKNHIKKSHFDGFYTYFAINGFSFGSSWKNWKDLNKFAEQNNLLFIPSLGPGYIDTQVRPWNADNTRHRRHGQYYETAWVSALNSLATTIAITSFNEWHEGTQIEPAKPASNKEFTYLDYEPEGPNFYLNLTKHWIEQFTKKYKKN